MASKQTRSFVLVFVIALACLYGSLLITREYIKNANTIAEQNKGNTAGDSDTQRLISFNNAMARRLPRTVDTTAWSEFVDTNSGLRFKYPSGWVATLEQFDQYEQIYKITLIPSEAKDYTMDIYVSKTDYLGLSGFKPQTVKINNLSALTVDELVYALKNGELYYTFDPGDSMALHPEFKALVKTVSFR
jgi:hypothetical protein